MSTNLKKLVEALEKQSNNQHELFNYAIPDTWLSFDYKGKQINVHDGHVLVNPYRFYQSLIEDVFLKNDTSELKSYFLTHPVEKNLQNGDWIRKSSVYSMMVRTTGSYDHDRTGRLEDSNLYQLKDTGTFLKTLAYLPLLKRMGIDVLYMLPIAKYSLKDKKGELGSPYGVSNFYALDEGLKDPMTGDYTTVNDEFKAFVEAAHALDMKVIIDIIPRTNSVNSDLIIDHPDWFYWIGHKDLDDYRPPMVDGLKTTLPAKKEYFKELFSSPSVEEHLHKFRKNPKDTDKEKWKVLVKEYKSKSNKKEILDLVQEHFGLTVAPAFSDHINDPQPAWSDVTFFRMYLDHPINSQPFLNELGTFEPYILFDVAKCSLNPGAQPNMPLWDMLSGIIPFYQTEFGIDGARIDMGHALPVELINMIISKAKAIDPNFCFIAEELDIENAQASIDKGYNMIIGDGFIKEPRVLEGMFNAFAYSAMNLPSPLFACGETHDTPRLAARPGQDVLAKMLTVFNHFIPNAIPFLNSGQEFFELQPMNTGLDCKPNEAEALPKNDPYYGKLALFDRYNLHYLHPRRWEMIETIEKASKIRASIIDSMLNMDKVYPLGFSAPWDTAAGFGYRGRNKMTLVITNTDVNNDKEHWVKLDNIPDDYNNEGTVLKQIFSSENSVSETDIVIDSTMNVRIWFKKGEVKILEIK